MLKIKYLFGNYELAKACLAQYDYDKASVDEMKRHFRISSNAIYPFKCGTDQGKVCFLRLSPSEEKAFSNVTSEIRLINWLIEQGYPAMRPVKMREGKWADRISTQWGVYNVSCFEAVAGNTLEDTEGTPRVVNGYGRMLERLHKLMKQYPFSEERNNHKDLLEVIRKRLMEFNAPQSVLAEWKSVCGQFSGLEIHSENYGVVHYDFEPDNVLYDEESDRFGVIDFDDAIRAWYSLDVVRALDALDDVVSEEQMKGAAEWFLQGYQSVCPFTEKQQKEMPLMRRFIHLQEYSTLLYAMSEPVEENPEWLVRLTGRLQHKLHKLEEGMKSFCWTS